MKFRIFQFPHVERVAEVKKRGFVEKLLPDRAVAYHKDIDIWNRKASMQGLADGTARGREGMSRFTYICHLLRSWRIYRFELQERAF